MSAFVNDEISLAGNSSSVRHISTEKVSYNVVVNKIYDILKLWTYIVAEEKSRTSKHRGRTWRHIYKLLDYPHPKLWLICCPHFSSCGSISIFFSFLISVCFPCLSWHYRVPYRWYDHCWCDVRFLSHVTSHGQISLNSRCDIPTWFQVQRPQIHATAYNPLILMMCCL